MNKPQAGTSAPPEIDYLSKDFASFRQLMVDQLTLLLPEWQEENPADIGHLLVDILAYAADRASYFQDAVATEAYLGTARLRRSVRRHARLLDYSLHEGNNARAWVAFQLREHSTDEDLGLYLPRGTQLLTAVKGAPTVLAQNDADYRAILAGEQATFFETKEDAHLYPAHNRLLFYRKPGSEPELPVGATEASLQWEDERQEHGLSYAQVMPHQGMLLLLEEVQHPHTVAGEPNPDHRQVVRLTDVHVDDIDGEKVLHITWHQEDALLFPLTIQRRRGNDISVARGNIVLADHGRTIAGRTSAGQTGQQGEVLPVVPATGRYRPHLKFGDVSHCEPYDERRASTHSAAATLQQDPRAALPAVVLFEHGPDLTLANPDALLSPANSWTQARTDCDFVHQRRWLPRKTMLGSQRLARDLVVEVEGDGRAYLRFGYGGLGRKPSVGARFYARYRVGNGPAGNVGRAAIAHIALPASSVHKAANVVEAVTNPLPASGGVARESLETARLHAPNVHRIQERAVTVADYEEIARRHADVAQAVADFRPRAGRLSAVVHVQRRSKPDIDEAFKVEMDRWFAPYRLMGHDVIIRGPHYVPLRLVLAVTVQPFHHASTVEQALRLTLSDRRLDDQHCGFFHKSQLTFGEPIYWSQVIARVMATPGVGNVVIESFGRLNGSEEENDPENRAGDGAASHGIIADEGSGRRVVLRPLEIARLANDPHNRANGIIEFKISGGL